MASPAVDVLNDDLLREVLIRLPSEADLIRAALACKSFLRAAGDAHFLRRFRALHLSSPLLLGFLFQAPGVLSPPIFVSDADAPAASTPNRGANFSLSLIHGGSCTFPQRAAVAWKLLDCRDGYLLLQRKYLKLAVANLMPPEYLLLPPLNPKAGRAVGYGLVVDDGYNRAFRVVCVMRVRGSSTLRALVLSSDERCWKEIADLTCDADPEVSKRNRTMHANGSLYWRLTCGKRMAVLDYAAPDAMQFSVINLPPSFSRLTFDVIEKAGANGDGHINLLTMRDYRIEHWVAAAGRGRDRAGKLTWQLLDKSLKFYNALESMFGKKPLRHHHLSVGIIGVVDGVVILRQRRSLLSIDLETMKITRRSEKVRSEARIYLYTRKRAWPPSFLKPTS